MVYSPIVSRNPVSGTDRKCVNERMLIMRAPARDIHIASGTAYIQSNSCKCYVSLVHDWSSESPVLLESFAFPQASIPHPMCVLYSIRLFSLMYRKTRLRDISNYYSVRSCWKKKSVITEVLWDGDISQHLKAAT